MNRTIRYFWNRRLARQLRKPNGAMGIKVAERMNLSNGHLYDLTWKAMNIKPRESILEIGFGNGMFFEKLLKAREGLQVAGIDFSASMWEEASRINQNALDSGRLILKHGPCELMDFTDEQFDHVYCINVVYFWENPAVSLREIRRVLKPGGSFCATFRDPASMARMPFTRFGFRAYSEESWSGLLKQNGFVYQGRMETEDPVSGDLKNEVPFRSHSYIGKKQD